MGRVPASGKEVLMPENRILIVAAIVPVLVLLGLLYHLEQIFPPPFAVATAIGSSR
jgi:hypothetical protein